MRWTWMVVLVVVAVAWAAKPMIEVTHFEIAQVPVNGKRGGNVPTVRVVLENQDKEPATELTLHLMKGNDEVSSYGPVRVEAHSKSLFTWQLPPGERQNLHASEGERHLDVTQGKHVIATGDASRRDPAYLESVGIDPGPPPTPTPSATGTNPPGF